MNFFLICIILGIIFNSNFFVFTDKRTKKFKKTIEQFKRDGIDMYISKNKNKEKYTYEEGNLSIDINKKLNKIEIKAYFKNFLEDKIIFLNMLYDADSEEWIKNIEHERNIKEFLGDSQEKIQLVNELKSLLIDKTNELFDTKIENGITLKTSNTDTTVSEIQTSSKQTMHSNPIPLFNLETLLKQGKFHWKKEGEREIYTTTEQDFTIYIDQDNDFQTIEILQAEHNIVKISYNPDKKEIKDLDINKGVMQKLKDIPTFVSLLQKILFFCYEQTHQQMNKVHAIIENFNSKPYNFIEKTNETNELIDWIDTNIGLLNTEDKHLFETIKTKRYPEIVELKNKLSFNASSENELSEMLEIILNLLKTLQSKINHETNKTMLIKERLIEQLKTNNEE